MFFDTHTHLDYLCSQYNLNLSEVINESLQVNVTKMLLTSVKSCQFTQIPQFIKEHKHYINYGVGLHPIAIAEHHQEDLNLLVKHLTKKAPNCVAVAEIGLDRSFEGLMEGDLWQKQLDFFTAQLSIAQDFNLPVSIHSRKTHSQILSYLKQYQMPQGGVIHGFSGSYEEAQQFIQQGFYLGVGGVITYPRANKTRQAIAKIPLEFLVLETDSPDMPIMGYQGKANMPKRLPLIFKTLCDLKNLSGDDCLLAEELLWRNSYRLFGNYVINPS